VERSRSGAKFTYDLEIEDRDGRILESWSGLELSMVEGTERTGAWLEGLVGPYIERHIGDLAGTTELRAALERGSALPVAISERGERTERALANLSGRPVGRRVDGKPTACDWHCSSAHSGSLTLRVVSPDPVSCDLGPRAERDPALWRALLGSARFDLIREICARSEDDLHAAATRIWGAMECLKKIGAPVDGPLLFREAGSGWVHLGSGAHEIATWSARIRGERQEWVLSVLFHAPEGAR
jgi:enediyne polyketide synthase